MDAAPPPVTAIGFAGVPPRVRAPELDIVMVPALPVERIVPLFVRLAVVIVRFWAAISDDTLYNETALPETVAAALIVGAKVLNVTVPLLALNVVVGVV